MISLIGWAIYIFIVMTLVQIFYPAAKDSKMPGFVAAICGSFTGGFFNYILGNNDTMLATSGVGMGVVGTLVILYVYDKYLKDIK